MTTILPQLQATQQAAAAVRGFTQKPALLLRLADVLMENSATIQTENQRDLALMPTTDPKWDRLLLTHERIVAIAESLRDISVLPDPTGEVLIEKTLDNGLKISKIAVSLGVVGVIYEARPNVTLDVSALCLRSGNAVVLRGGSDAWFSNSAIVGLIHSVLEEFNLPKDAVALLPPDRELMKEFLAANKYVDILIPRGSDALIQFVRQNSLIPTIETGAGVVHTYIHAEADIEKARAITVNARTSRPSVCNSLDCVIVDEAVLVGYLAVTFADWQAWNVAIYADEAAHYQLNKMGYPFLHRATPEDFGREWLDYKLTIKTVSNLSEALAHISEYSSKHSEAIVSENPEVCQQFLEAVDAAAVYANASTRFTDGGQFGLGAEIGISTQKLHARGPFALEKLVTEKWIVIGDGQIRG